MALGRRDRDRRASFSLRRRPQQIHSPGFTLIEVLVATAVASIVTVSVLGALTGMASHLDRYREETQLAFLLQAVAGEMIGRGIPTDDHGYFDTHPGYKWRIEKSPFANSTNGASITEIPEVAALTVIRITVTSPSGRSTSASLIAS